MQVRIEESDGELVLNLAPMIDVVFLLLIFFMVATTFVEREKELGLDLPTAASGEEPGHRPDELVINLLRDGAVRLNGETVSRERLEELLAAAARTNPAVPVTIRGDREVVLQRVVSVMDACRLAGLTDIGMTTLDG